MEKVLDIQDSRTISTGGEECILPNINKSWKFAENQHKTTLKTQENVTSKVQKDRESKWNR